MYKMEIFKTVEKDSKAEMIEKKSKFIAHVFKVESLKDSEEKINYIKRKYYDAKHNCFAFSIVQEHQVISKFSDDGEPQGTAGEPILNVIKKNGISNILIVVTRYFGGILLGTGGLTRAYSNVSAEALKDNNIVYQTFGIQGKIEVTYENNGKFKRYCEQNNIKINKIDYKENIFYIIETNEKDFEKLKEIVDEKNKRESFKIVSCVAICHKYVEIAR